jgi:hypothetical protein
MPRILNQIPRTRDLIPGPATKAPLGRLSCPYGSRDPAAEADEDPRRAIGTQGAGRQDRTSDSPADAPCGHAEPWDWRDSLTTDFWSPPTSESRRARQRILAVIVAFVLAAILAQAGW